MAPIFGRRALRAVAGSGTGAAPDGRSLWQDARARFLRNRAAVASLAVLALVAVFALLGDLIAVWSNEEIDWSILGSVAEKGAPSLANGHWFGVDELGRDLFARTVQGTRISMMVGVVGALIAVVVGTLYGATAGYFGGRARQRDDAYRGRAHGHPLHVRADPVHGGLRPFDPHALRGDRPHQLARHGTDRPGSGAEHQEPGVRRGRGGHRSPAGPDHPGVTSFPTCWAWSSSMPRCWSPR